MPSWELPVSLPAFRVLAGLPAFGLMSPRGLHSTQYPGAAGGLTAVAVLGCTAVLSIVPHGPTATPAIDDPDRRLRGVPAPALNRRVEAPAIEGR